MSVRSRPNREFEGPVEPQRHEAELPAGWTHCRVDDVFHVSSGGTPSRTEPRYWNGNVPWLSSGDIKTDEIDVGSEFITDAGLQNSTAKLCQAGSVVVVVRSGVLKHTLPVALLRRPAAINQDMKCFDSGDRDLNRWFALALRTASRNILTENREGTTVQSVKSETLREFAFPLPPLAEQRRIVGKLELLLGKVSSSQQRLSRVPGLLKRFRQSVLAAACSGKLTADWREENDSVEDWASTIVGEIGHVTGGITKNSKRESLPLKIPYLRVANVYANRLELADVTEIGVTHTEATRTKLEAGDLLFVEGNGSLDQIGRVAIWDGSIPNCVHQNHIIKFRANTGVEPRFVLLSMMSPIGRERLMEQAVSSAGLHTLSISKIAAIETELPPLSEQQEIVRRVEKLFAFADQIEARLRIAVQHVDRLTQSLLAKAFRGELVPTEHTLATAANRDYESASQLLKRIRTANASASSPKPKRGKASKT